MANKRISELGEVTPAASSDLLLSILDPVVTYTATTISGAAEDNSLNDSAAQFVAKGFAAGDQVCVSGGSNVWHSATVMSRTAGKLVLGGLAAGAVINAAAGTAVTITKWVSGRASASAVAALLGGGDTGTVTALALASGAVDVDCSAGDYFTLALTANVTGITFSNLPGSGKGASKLIRITQDATPRTVTWPASFKWPGGSAGAVSTGSGAVDVLAISSFDNGATWRATLAKAFA